MSTAFMTFGLGETVFALPVTLVQEILDVRPVSRLPDRPPHVLGLTDVRGSSVTVLDLRHLVGEAPRDNTPETRVVVLATSPVGEESQMALRVDRVIEVTGLDGDRLEPVTGAGRHGWDGGMVEGVGRRNGEFVIVLRREALLRGWDGVPSRWSGTSDGLVATEAA